MKIANFFPGAWIPEGDAKWPLSFTETYWVGEKSCFRHSLKRGRNPPSGFKAKYDLGLAETHNEQCQLWLGSTGRAMTIQPKGPSRPVSGDGQR